MVQMHNCIPHLHCSMHKKKSATENDEKDEVGEIV